MALFPVREATPNVAIQSLGMRDAAGGRATMWADEDRELQFGQLWMLLRRNWFTVLVCMALPIAAAVAYIRIRTPVYESSTMIRIAGTPVGVTNVVAAPASDAVSTEMAVLGSQTLASAAMEDAALRLELLAPTRVSRNDLIGDITIARTPDTATVTLMRQIDGRFAMTTGPEESRHAGPYAIGDTIRVAGAKFTLYPAAAPYPVLRLALRSPNSALLAFQHALKIVRPSSEADVILVKYRGTDATLTQAVLASLSGRFMTWRQEVLTADARSRSKLLREEIDTLSVRLREAEGELRTFQQSKQVIDPVTEASTDVTRLSQMQADRAALESERSALTRMLDQAYVAERDDAAGELSPFAKLVAFPTLLRNAATTQLVAALETAQDERVQLLARRKNDDPDVQILSARIRQVEGQLRSLVITYTSGLAQQEDALDASLAAFNRQLRDVPQRTIEYAQLDRKPKVLSDLYEVLETQLKEAEVAQAAVDPTVQVVDAAVTAVAPVSPRPLLDGIAGVILGLMLALGVVFLREHLDPYVHTRADVQRVMGVPVLGLVPHLRLRRRSLRLFAGRRRQPALATGLVADEVRATGMVGPQTAAHSVPALADDPDSRAQAAEAFARLHTNIQFLQPSAAVKTLVVTSAMAEEGKTTSATHLALAIAQRGQRVLLIDADLRRGAVHTAFGINRSPGLSTLLNEGTPLEEVTRVFAVAGSTVSVHVVASGPLSNSPAALLASERMRELVRQAQSMFDVVVIDSPPINVVSDAAILSTLAEGVVVVVRAGVTARGALAYASDQLRMVSAPVMGAILNDVDFRRDTMYDATYRYYGRPEHYRITDDAGVGQPA